MNEVSKMKEKSLWMKLQRAVIRDSCMLKTGHERIEEKKL